MPKVKDNERQQAFIAYRHLFSGKGSKISIDNIKHILQEHHKKTGIPMSPKGVAHSVSMIQSLMDKKCFISDTYAKELFPDLFRSTTSQQKSREALRQAAISKESQMLASADAATVLDKDDTVNHVDHEIENNLHAHPATVHKSENTALLGTPDAVTKSDDNVNINPNKSGSQPGLRTETGVAHMPNHGVSQQVRTIDKPSSLFPVYLPFNAQHLILTGVQEILEQCCFDFVCTWLPEQIYQNDWETPAEVELSHWTKFLPDWEPRLPPGAISNHCLEGHLKEACSQVEDIQNAAVHRLRLSAGTLHSQLTAAMALASYLQDEPRCAMLTRIFREFDDAISELESGKNFIENTFDRDAAAIAEQRRQLNETELELKCRVTREDTALKAKVGSKLRTSMRQILNDMPSDTDAEEVTAEGYRSINEAGAASSWSAITQIFATWIPWRCNESWF